MPFKAETGVKGRVDWTLLLAAAGLVLLGTIAMLSAASPLPYYASLLQKHFIAVALGLLLFFGALTFNYQIYQDQAKVLYALVVALLVAVLLVGTTVKGHRSWLNLGFVNFQPAEFARIGTILVLAAFLDSRTRKIESLTTVFAAFAVCGPVLALILKQPDLGSTLTFAPFVLAMLFCAGANISHLAGIVGFGGTAALMPILFTIVSIYYPQPVKGTVSYFILESMRFSWAMVAVIGAGVVASLAAWRLAVMARTQPRAIYFIAFPIVLALGLVLGAAVNQKLKGYQRNRFVAYVAPQSDIQGAAYNVNQAQIAIGSGGVLGKGLFAGTQSQLGFLPERHTDFIYAVIGEEMGFLGSFAIVGLYMLLIWRIVNVGKLARDRFGFLVCSGLAAMFAFQLTLNAGMCLGIMPVTGVPLPLISYGGSSLMITMWALGIVANIYSRRYALL